MTRWVKAVACAVGLASAPVQAADSGFYFGVMGGRADYDLARPTPVNLFLPDPIPSGGVIGISPNLPPFLNPGVPAYAVGAYLPAGWLTTDQSEEATAWGLTAGYRIMRYAAVELSYIDLGKLEQGVPILSFPSGQPSYEIRQQMRTSGPTVSALGTLPIGAGFSLYARAGVIFAEMDAKTSTGSFSDDTSFSSQSGLWGAGAQFDWGDHWSLRLDFQRFEGLGDRFEPVEADVDLLTLGVLYRL